VLPAASPWLPSPWLLGLWLLGLWLLSSSSPWLLLLLLLIRSMVQRLIHRWRCRMTSLTIS